MTFFKQALGSILEIIYPEICIACNENNCTHSLCATCRAHLSIINLKERCPHCFSPRENHLCKKSDYLAGVASVFEKENPASSLLKKLKYQKAFTLATSLGNFMALQFLKLNWPLPDLIIPTPQPLSKKIAIGYNPNLLLGKALGKTLQVPCMEVLKVKNAAFYKKPSPDIEDKILLLVETEFSLNSAAECLAKYAPRSLYYITLVY